MGLKSLISVRLKNYIQQKSVVSLLHFACDELRNNGEMTLLYFLCHRAAINIPGFGAVQIDIKYICECECTSAAEKNSPQCNETGTLECAICKCNEGFFGDSCQCGQSSSINPNNALQSCLNRNDNTTCSNKGSCVCGKCVCNKQTVGLNIFS